MLSLGTLAMSRLALEADTPVTIGFHVLESGSVLLQDCQRPRRGALLSQGTWQTDLKPPQVTLAVIIIRNSEIKHFSLQPRFLPLTALCDFPVSLPTL